MENVWHTIVERFVARFDGPLHFRMIVQPLIAVILAIIDGIKDAKNGRPPYFWTVIIDREHRIEFLKDGWKHIVKVFIIAIILDTVYQLRVFHAVYPVRSLIVAFVLAIIPYVLVRGPVRRLMMLFAKKKA